MNNTEGLAEEVAVLATDKVITELARRSIAFLPDKEWAKLFEVNGMPTKAYAAEVMRVYRKKKLKLYGLVEDARHEAAPALAVAVARQRLETWPGGAERISNQVFAEVAGASAAIEELFGPRYVE